MSEAEQVAAAHHVMATLATERGAWPATNPVPWQEHLRREFLRHLGAAGLDTDAAAAELAAELAAVDDPRMHLEQLVAEARVIELLGLQETLRQQIALERDV